MTPDPMRIAMYTSLLPEPGVKPGGVDILIHRLANTLVERGHDVTISSYSPLPEGARYGHRQLGPKKIAMGRLTRMTIAPLRLNRLSFADADVVHLHGDDWFYVRRPLPTVRTLYGSALYEMRYATRPRRALSQAVLVPLEMLSCRLATRSYGMIPGDGPVHRLDGYLPGAAAPPADASADRSPHPTILFVGTWHGRKRGVLLRDEFVRTVLPAHPDAQLWCVSDQCEESNAVKWIRTPTDDELDDLYRRAWVFCLPSRYEGFGLPYVEAMAHGLPIVATRNPGASFITRAGEDGIVVADHALGTSLSALLGDAPRRNALARAGTTRAAEFTWARCAERHEAAYRNAITTQRPRRASSGRSRRSQ